ncbi:MAG: DUF692 domain-containing protein [Myxococcota bacterium]|nr:DUF692 domain-containing protein [Myxococcota bacterium]
MDRVKRDALGLGLRPPHYEALLRERPAVDFFEIIAENYLDSASFPRVRLREIAEIYPLVAHGVSLNLLGSTPLDQAHLLTLRSLLDEFEIPYFSDHLCWTRSGERQHHDLLPAPYDPSLIPYAAARAAETQRLLGRPFGIENLSSYLRWRQDSMSEWDFYRQVVEASGCWYMVDINNIYVSSQNHGFDPRVYLEALDWDRVLQVHLAGHQLHPSGLYHDTHDRPVSAEVWRLYGDAWRFAGPFPTLVEWDAEIPPLSQLLDELDEARHRRSAEIR